MNKIITNGAIYELIRKELETLPGEVAHAEMIPFRLKSSLALAKGPSPKLSAVLCLLYKKNDMVNIILMERQQDGSTHSGQISFPGGKKEKEDKNMLETALRETEEEIGINRAKVNVLGKLTNVYIPVSNFLVEPYIGWIDQPGNLVLSEREVRSVFDINIKELMDPSRKIKTDIPNNNGHTLKNVPCFYINDKIIWGATSLMLNELKHILLRIKDGFGQNQML